MSAPFTASSDGARKDSLVSAASASSSGAGGGGDCYGTGFGTKAKPSMFTLLLRYPVARRNFMLITFNWFANALVYNGLSFYSANLNVNSFLGFFIRYVGTG